MHTKVQSHCNAHLDSARICTLEESSLYDLPLICAAFLKGSFRRSLVDCGVLCAGSTVSAPPLRSEHVGVGAHSADALTERAFFKIQGLLGIVVGAHRGHRAQNSSASAPIARMSPPPLSPPERVGVGAHSADLPTKWAFFNIQGLLGIAVGAHRGYRAQNSSASAPTVHMDFSTSPSEPAASIEPATCQRRRAVLSDLPNGPLSKNIRNSQHRLRSPIRHRAWNASASELPASPSEPAPPSRLECVGVGLCAPTPTKWSIPKIQSIFGVGAHTAPPRYCTQYFTPAQASLLTYAAGPLPLIEVMC
ncbi:hypothetical protein C8R45DRAFT_947930 [Mycena sanguinolenta]|nr:hypothetical protein C8R45DRAFT_947930 [Mycena sanguinolenta]